VATTLSGFAANPSRARSDVTFELYAHRGAAAELPENTLAAFDRALELGATAIETDCQISKDGHVVLCHDPVVTPKDGVPRRIAESTLEQIQRLFTIPTLEEALAHLPHVPFNVDCKPRGRAAAAALVRVVRKMGAEERVLIASFRTRTLGHVRELGYEGRTGLGQSEIFRLAVMPYALLRAIRIHGNAAQVPTRAFGLRFDTRRFLDKCHALGLLVHYWTIDDPREARRLLELGADGVMTNDPRVVAPAVVASGGPSTDHGAGVW
jgi:glycerophosphoryl diester phosphodiesterase